jgi:hypothetical protein
MSSSQCNEIKKEKREMEMKWKVDGSEDVVDGSIQSLMR